MRLQKNDFLILLCALLLGGLMIYHKHLSLKEKDAGAAAHLPVENLQHSVKLSDEKNQIAIQHMQNFRFKDEPTQMQSTVGVKSIENDLDTKTDEISPFTSELKALSAHFYQFIPRKASLQSGEYSEADMHHAPKPVDDAALMMGKIHEFFSEHPEMVKESFDFYMRCSQQKDFLTSVRALCAARASQNFFELTGKKMPSAAFDLRVAQLKDQISL